MLAKQIDEGDTVVTETGKEYTVEEVPPWKQTIKGNTVEYNDKLKVRVPETVFTTTLPVESVKKVR